MSKPTTLVALTCSTLFLAACTTPGSGPTANATPPSSTTPPPAGGATQADRRGGSRPAEPAGEGVGAPGRTAPVTPVGRPAEFEPGAPETVTTMTAAPLPNEDAAVAGARENLRISRLTLDRIRANLDTLQRQPDAEPAVLRDYSIYMETVRTMTDAHEQVLAGLTGSSPAAPGAGVGTRWDPVDPMTFDPPVEFAPDRIAMLDREFDDEIAAFDAFLLEEQFEARRRRQREDGVSSEGMTDLAQEAAAAVERLRKKGIEIDTGAPGDGAEGSEGTGGAGGESGGETGAEGAGGGGGGGTEGSEPGTGAPPAGSGSGAGGSGGAGSGEPGSGAPGGGGTGEKPGAPNERGRPSGEDDDIVARQLREAAERETDPVLKEKLWEEYERYKRSS